MIRTKKFKARTRSGVDVTVTVKMNSNTSGMTQDESERFNNRLQDTMFDAIREATGVGINKMEVK